jgi:hypothetical protein
MQTVDAGILVSFTANCSNQVVVCWGGAFILAQWNSLVLFQTLYWNGW